MNQQTKTTTITIPNECSIYFASTIEFGANSSKFAAVGPEQQPEVSTSVEANNLLVGDDN